MPVDYKQSVLLGDNDPDRSAFLTDLLKNTFSISDVVVLNLYENVEAQVRKAMHEGSHWKLVLMAAELQSLKNEGLVLPRDFGHIATNNNEKIGCFYTNGEPPNPKFVGSNVPAFFIPSPVDSNNEEDQRKNEEARRKDVVENIENALIPGLKSRRQSEVEIDDDPILIKQIRGLASAEDLKSAKLVLSFLIGNFHGDREPVIVSKLSQGASGSKVFRFRPKDEASEVNERVIKISHYSQGWKLDEEVKKHEIVQETFSRYKGHVPELESFVADGDRERIAHYDNWRAIAYDFLGGSNFKKANKRFGKFMDLETAIIGAQQELQEKTAETPLAPNFATPGACAEGRKSFLEILLNWLSKNWYLERSSRGEEKPLWDYSSASDKSFDGFPPYRIPGRSKRYILNFLDSGRAEIGQRLCPRWEDYHQIVREFVSAESHTDYSLATPQGVIVSPAHGDLNSNNILLWLDEEHPFLIDFPFYQESGHALQDFARLEVEMKFTLMDRQADSAANELPAFDYTHSQLAGWLAFEEALLTEDWDGRELILPANCFEHNIRLTYELVSLIRRQAVMVQRQHQTTPEIPFWTEYRPALLYHTLRAIGYDSLSPFKRILAVCSSARLLEQCRVA